MSLSLCSHCGGHIQLGPDASNVCEVCGKHVMSGPAGADMNDTIITERQAEAIIKLLAHGEAAKRATNEQLARFLLLSCNSLPLGSDSYDLMEEAAERLCPGTWDKMVAESESCEPTSDTERP